MKATKLDERFFDSTRGRIVTLLRGGAKTVNELKEELGLTDNAVRAHLLSLERDGFVKQSGVRRGFRKPHFAYRLTSEAEHLFPKAYDMVLNRIIAVLKGRLSAKALNEVLRGVGRSLAEREGSSKKRSLESRARDVLEVLEKLGGAGRIEKENGKLLITSRSCPLGNAVVEHPEICQLAEALVSETVGTSVQERCERDDSPRCRFEINEEK